MHAASVKSCWDTMLFVTQADISLLLLLAMLLILKHVCIIDLDDDRTPTSHHAYSVGVLWISTAAHAMHGSAFMSL